MPHPFGRDVVGELADACHRKDMRLHLYYSHIDWWRTDAPAAARGWVRDVPSPR